MKLAAIYNVFDGLELLKGSIQQIRQHVDGVVIVGQEVSNWGEVDTLVFRYCDYLERIGLVDQVLEYVPGGVASWKDAQRMEIAKRQAGINWAQENGYTHFILMDCDEYYDTEQFARMKEKATQYGGAYHPLWTYYKFPTLRFATQERYFVPGIHRLNNYTTTGGSHYPVLVDPTRRINEKNILASDIPMHHFSYVRGSMEAIKKKLRNSTARNNINNKAVLDAYLNAKAGEKVPHIDAGELVEVMDKFGIYEKIKEYFVFSGKPVQAGSNPEGA